MHRIQAKAMKNLEDYERHVVAMTEGNEASGIKKDREQPVGMLADQVVLPKD